MNHDPFAEVRERLDVREVAEAEGLSRRGRHFDCPACGRKLKAMSRDGCGWYCVACQESGDAVDLLKCTRGVDTAEALRLARELAGILDEDRSRWTPPPPRRPTPLPPELASADADLRLRAVRHAAVHYAILGGWSQDDDTPSIASYLRHLRDFGALQAHDARQTMDDAAKIHAYGAKRLAPLRGCPEPMLGFLVGAAPGPRSGLRERLKHFGGDELVAAGQRAGLTRPDGTDALGGRLVFVWTDARGAPIYLTGRAVPGLTHAGAPKALALPVFGGGTDAALGVPRPGVPFGLHMALALPDPVFIVEGELQALAALAVGIAAVATGGTGRAKPEDLAKHLAGRELIVRFDSEATADKQARTDARAQEVARALRCRWVPPHLRRALNDPEAGT